MVKLQKQKSYHYKDKEHYKHVVILPEKVIEELGWGPGENLTFSISKSGLTINTETLENLEETEIE